MVEPELWLRGTTITVLMKTTRRPKTGIHEATAQTYWHSQGGNDKDAIQLRNRIWRGVIRKHAIPWGLPNSGCTYKHSSMVVMLCTSRPALEWAPWARGQLGMTAHCCGDGQLEHTHATSTKMKMALNFTNKTNRGFLFLFFLPFHDDRLCRKWTMSHSSGAQWKVEAVLQREDVLSFSSNPLKPCFVRIYSFRHKTALHKIYMWQHKRVPRKAKKKKKKKKPSCMLNRWRQRKL